MTQCNHHDLAPHGDHVQWPVMAQYHLTLGANLLLWVFPLLLTIGVVILAVADRRDKEDPG